MSYSRKFTVMWTAVFILIASTVLFTPRARADIPQLVNYQGRMTDGPGDPVDTTVSMVFTIYDDSSEGDSRWIETHESVSVVSGFFSVILGSTVPIDDSVFAESNCWLGIQFGSDPEIEPRTRLVTTPFSYRARIAEFVGEVDTFYVDTLLDMLLNTAIDIQMAYATCEGGEPGCLAEEINIVAQNYMSDFCNWLRLRAGICDTLMQSIFFEVIDSVETWAIDDLTSYGKLIDTAQLYNDTASLEQFDSAVHEHDLLRLANITWGITDWIKDNIVDPVIEGGEKVKDWAEDNAEDLADKVVEDLPAVGDAAGKAADEIKKAINGAIKIK